MNVEFPKGMAELQAERAELVGARLTELASLLPVVADRIVAHEISPRELTTMANRMHGIADLMGAVSVFRDRHP